VQLNDEVAEEVMREAARTKLERCLTTALEAVKKRTRVRDYSPAIQVLFPCITPSSFSLDFVEFLIGLHQWADCTHCASIVLTACAKSSKLSALDALL